MYLTEVSKYSLLACLTLDCTSLSVVSYSSLCPVLNLDRHTFLKPSAFVSLLSFTCSFEVG